MSQLSNYQGKLFQKFIVLVTIGLLFTTIEWSRPGFWVDTSDTNIPAPLPPRTADWLIPAPTIVITGDAGWDTCPWVNGSGTWADPYRICNLTINAGGSGCCISISSTTKPFRIINCSLMGAGSLSFDAEILVDTAENGTLINNTCTNHSILANCLSGIALHHAKNITLINNNCAGNSYGIYLSTADNNTLMGNNCTKNGYGIHLKDDAANNTLIGNTITGSLSFGIYLDSVHNNTLSGNNCTGGGGDGIDLVSSINNTLAGNNCSGNFRHGIILSLSSKNVVAGNNCTGTNRTGNTQIGIWLDSANNNTLTDNTCRWNANGITLTTASTNNTFTRNTCTGNYYGISLQDSSVNNTFARNNCTGNRDYAIFLRTASNNTLDSNNCTGCSTHGIHLDSTSNYNSITNNNCTANGWGIYIEDSKNNTLTGNTCSNNTQDGIYLEDSSNNTLVNNIGAGNTRHGLSLLRSPNCTLAGNNCTNNAQYGIYLSQSLKSKLINNTCTRNALFGMYITQSANNTVTGNNCSKNLFIGIGLSYSDNNTLSGNNCTRNSNTGIRLDYSNNNTLMENNYSRNAIGIYLTSGASYNEVCFNWLKKNTGSAVPDDSGLYNNVHDNFITYLPSTSFIANRIAIIIGQSIAFNSTLSGGVAPFVYQWDFKDDSPNGNTENVTHQFTSMGTRQVTLTVTDGEGDTSIYQLSINVNALLVASFTASDVDITPGDSVTFSDTTTGGVAPYAHYEWYFGDNTANSTLQNPTHQFSQPGSYQVTLTTTDANGNMNCYQFTIVVTPVGGFNTPITAVVTSFLVVEYSAFGLIFVAFVYIEVWLPRKKKGRVTRP